MEHARIRAARAEDVEGIQRLLRQLDAHHAILLPEVFQPVDGDARPADMIAQSIQRGDAAWLVAETDGKIVGFVNVQKSAHPKYPMFRLHDYALIENVVVDKGQRRKGIGKALFDAAIAWARDRGMRYVQTTVWCANEIAREFYRSQGFRPLTERLELDLNDAAGRGPMQKKGR